MKMFFLLTMIFISVLIQSCTKRYLYDGNFKSKKINNYKADTDSTVTCIRDTLCIKGFDNIKWQFDSLSLNGYRIKKSGRIWDLLYDRFYKDNELHIVRKLDNYRLTEQEILNYLGKPNYVIIDTNAISMDDNFRKTYLYTLAGGYENNVYIDGTPMEFVFDKSDILVGCSYRTH